MSEPIDVIRIATLEQQVAELTAKLEGISPTPVRQKVESLERFLEMALSRMDGDVQRAANLFLAWTEQNSEVKESLKPLIQEALERRLAEIPRAEPNLA